MSCDVMYVVSALWVFAVAVRVAPQAVFASLRSRLDLVAFTEDVPRVRKYLTKRFAAPNGQLTPEVEDALDRESVSGLIGAGGRGPYWRERMVGFSQCECDPRT